MSKSWDNGILKKLKALLGKGLSTSEIGKRLGISKNAVVGKLHRLGWNSSVGDADAGAKKSAVSKKSAAAPKKTTGKKGVVAAVKPVKLPKVDSKKALRAKPVAPDKPKRVTIRSSKESAVHQRMVQHALEMANLKPNQCRWPIGDPDSDGFHFCGNPVFVGKPYCYEHCKQAYQFTPVKKK
jgi:GcrA cell cycle regulator